MVREREYSASEIRRLLQELFPHRRLVLSQLTFFNHSGVATPTGETFRRGRRCYRLEDVLSVACVLALKEEGIPLKNIDSVPALIQKAAAKIFDFGMGCQLTGYKDAISLSFPGEKKDTTALDAFLAEPMETKLFWGFDVGLLARHLEVVAEGFTRKDVRRAA